MSQTDTNMKTKMICPWCGCLAQVERTPSYLWIIEVHPKEYGRSVCHGSWCHVKEEDAMHHAEQRMAATQKLLRERVEGEPA